MKFSESAAFQLFDKYSLSHPRLSPVSGRVVVKADLPMGGKKKAGLVKICDFKDAHQIAQEMGVPTIIEEFIEHDKEYFLAIKAVRGGIEVYFSELGGIDVEQNWEKVDRALVPTEKLLGKNRNFLGLDKLITVKVVRVWIEKLIQFFQEEDASYLEINPFTIVSRQVMPLGVVLIVDEAAKFRHPDWSEVSLISSLSSREKKVAEIDSEIKGSTKLVEVPIQDTEYKIQNTKLTAVMGGGAGSVLFLCDAILENGLQLADYSEFSGNPPNWALTELTKEVCKIPGIKNLVIGSGIANFTPASENIKAIIEGLKQSPRAKNLNIVVRRCGPGEEEGINLMKWFAKDYGYNIQVFGRETGMTDIVSKLK